jgi:hypothetical protein
MGGANILLSGVAAGYVGVQIGEVISQYLERETSKTFDRIEKGSDIELKLREAAFGKTTPEQKLQIIKEAEAHKQESMPNQFNKIWHSLLGAVTGEKSTWELWREQNKGINEKIDLVRMAFDAQSAQLKNIENYYNPNKEFQGNIPESKNVFSGMPSWKTEIPEYQERQAGITQMANEIAGRVHKQDLDLFKKTFGEFAPLDVNIKIENEGEGKVTATTKTKGPRAPRVDVSRAGANQ